MNALKLFKYLIFPNLWLDHHIAPALAAAGISALGGVAGKLLGGDAPEGPNAAEMAWLAKKQAGLDQEAAQGATMANRPDIYGPAGSTVWEQGLGGDPNKWSATQTLTPEGQAAFESSQRFQTGLSGLGEQAIGGAQGVIGTPYETPGQMPGYTGPEGELSPFGENRQRVSDAMLSRVNTDIGRDRETKSAELIARGIPQGSEAYNREMEQIDRKQTDARQQAEIAATGQAVREYGADIAGRGQMGREGMADYSTGMEGYQQGISNALLERSTPLNELSALQSGAQVDVPNMPTYGQQQFTGGPNLMGATQAGYQNELGAWNADQAFNNQIMGGLFDMGSAYVGAGGFGGGGGGGTGSQLPSSAYTSPDRPLGWY